MYEDVVINEVLIIGKLSMQNEQLQQLQHTQHSQELWMLLWQEGQEQNISILPSVDLTVNISQIRVSVNLIRIQYVQDGHTNRVIMILPMDGVLV